jgi:hypothetical protein
LLFSGFLTRSPSQLLALLLLVLGASLDRLAAKVKDPSQLDVALSGVKQFNKDPNFYSGYAKNFIMKSVKKGSDADPRVGYIKQVRSETTYVEEVVYVILTPS